MQDYISNVPFTFCADNENFVDFVGKHIKLKNGERIEYVCDIYHRYGKEHCTSYTIREELLDQLIIEELQRTKRMYQWKNLYL